MPSALVLAAGLGTRMGAPKALLEVHGRTLVDQHVARFTELGCTRIVVVTRPSMASFIRGAEVVAIESASQDESLDAGLAVLDGIVFITPVDLVPPRANTLVALVRALAPDLDAVTPRFRDRGGHPVLARVEALRGGGPLRDRLRALGERRARVSVDDRAVLGDLDRPSDLISA